MNKQRIRSNIILLAAAAIWGFAFVEQRVGVEYIGSFSFNGIRFALGGFSGTITRIDRLKINLSC